MGVFRKNAITLVNEVNMPFAFCILRTGHGHARKQQIVVGKMSIMSANDACAGGARYGVEEVQCVSVCERGGGVAG